MQLYAVELLALHAIPVCIVRSSSMSGFNMTQGNASSSAFPSFGDNSVAPGYQLLVRNETTGDEERVPSPVSLHGDLVNNVLKHFTPNSWVNADVAYKWTASDRSKLQKHVLGDKKSLKNSPKAIERLIQLSSRPADSRKQVSKWITAIRHNRRKKPAVKKKFGNVDEWLKNRKAPHQVFEKLHMYSEENIFLHHRVEVLEDYILMYNEKYGGNCKLLETLVDCFGVKPGSSTQLSNKGDQSKSALSKGNVILALKLSFAKMSVFTTDEAMLLQQELLTTWISDGIRVDDVYEELKQIASASKSRYFLSLQSLDTFVEFVKLANEKLQLPKTNAFAYMKQKGYGHKFIKATLEKKKQHSAYAEWFLHLLHQSQEPAELY